MIESLWRHVLRDFPLGEVSIHGPSHWARVERNGLYLAEQMGLPGKLVSLFALFHDCQRQNDGVDHGHGRRGAAYIDQVSNYLVDLSPQELASLKQACCDHTDQLTTETPFYAVCWDADRLDIGRIGDSPRIEYLNTEPARRLVRQGDLKTLLAIPPRSLEFLRDYDQGE